MGRAPSGASPAPGRSQAASPGTEADSSRDVYINMLSKPQLKNNLGAVLGTAGGGKKEKAKKALGLVCSCSRDSHDFTHMGLLR